MSDHEKHKKSTVMHTYGMQAHRQHAANAALSKWHPEVEILVPEKLPVSLLVGGKQVTLQVGRLAVFWAVTPHHIVNTHQDAILNWLTLPLPNVMQWQLPGELLRRLLHRDVLFDPGEPASEDIVNMARWRKDMESGQPTRRQLVLLEAHARLFRLSLESSFSSMPVSESSEEHVERMAVYIARNFDGDLKVTDIARHVNLHARYATTIFRQTVGMPLQDYIMQHRLAHAQQLLVATDLSISSVAEQSGFRTSGCFYAMFRDRIGCTPNGYRRRIHNVEASDDS